MPDETFGLDRFRRAFVFTDEAERKDGPAEKRTINFAAMAVAGNPAPVRDAIAEHRAQLDRAPYQTLLDGLHDREREVCQAVRRYFDVPESNIALTTGTTLGLALMYAGVHIRPGQEILTTQHEFSKTLQIFDLRRGRDGTPNRRLPLLPSPADVTVDSVLAGLKDACCSHTRVLALQWVYSNTGVKLPIPEIAGWLATVNRGRGPDERVLLCVDGVHGFGVENMRFDALGCDFFVSGCHKWVFGPRGTGIWCGTDAAWSQYTPVVPTSSDASKPGLKHSPGGVQAYEHWWALEEAFLFLMDYGQEKIAARVHQLASDFKRDISTIRGVTVVTPMASRYSSGIVCFDIDRLKAVDAVERLAVDHDIRATVSSSDAGRPGLRHVRVSIAAFNTEAEVQACVTAVKLLAEGR